MYQSGRCGVERVFTPRELAFSGLVQTPQGEAWIAGLLHLPATPPQRGFDFGLIQL
jgi:hypothetical protein